MCRSYRTLTSLSAFLVICSNDNQSSFFSCGEPSKISTVRVHRMASVVSGVVTDYFVTLSNPTTFWYKGQ